MLQGRKTVLATVLATSFPVANPLPANIRIKKRSSLVDFTFLLFRNIFLHIVLHTFCTGKK